MRDFVWRSPTEFVFGRDAESEVGEKLAELGVRRVFLHYGQGSVVRSGLLDRVRESLDAAGIERVELGGVRPNPEVTLVREGIELVRDEEPDFLLAVGGGSVIDSLKAIAAGAACDDDVWCVFDGTGAITHEVLPIGTVLTIPAAGSEASAASVISNDEIGMKTGFGDDRLRPRVSFMNPELTMTLPPYQTAAGISDMLAHIFERFFSASPATPVSDNISLGLVRAIMDAARTVMEDPEDYDARAELMWAGTLAHNGLCGRGRLEDWATHGMEHELSAVDTRVTHGAGLAVMFPAWMRYVYHENPARFIQFGREVFGMEPTGDDDADALAVIDAIQEFFVSIGMPTTITELGIEESDIERMLDPLTKNYGEEFGSFKRLTRDDARAIYRSAL